MAEVTLSIGGRPHRVACRDGEESRLRMLGQMLDERWARRRTRRRRANAERAMLFVALMLADDLDEMRTPPAAGRRASARTHSTRIAERLESLARPLSKPHPAS